MASNKDEQNFLSKHQDRGLEVFSSRGIYH